MKLIIVSLICFLCMSVNLQRKRVPFSDFSINIPKEYTLHNSTEKRYVFNTEKGLVVSVSYNEKKVNNSELKTVANNTIISMSGLMDDFSISFSGEKFFDELNFINFDYYFSSQNLKMLTKAYFASLNGNLLIISITIPIEIISDGVSSSNSIMNSFKKKA